MTSTEYTSNQKFSSQSVFKNQMNFFPQKPESKFSSRNPSFFNPRPLNAFTPNSNFSLRKFSYNERISSFYSIKNEQDNRKQNQEEEISLLKDTYKKTLNKETNEMKYFITKLKEEAKVNLNKLFTLNTDNVLTDIENKLNNTVRAVEAYKSHNETFKIPKDVKIYLDDFGKDVIYPKYQNIKNMLDEITKEIIIDNLYKNSEEFKKKYQIEIFENKINEINNNMTENFKEMNESLKKYGALESEYKKNLDKEISNYQRIRRLDELDNEKIIYKQQAANLKLDKTFQELKKSSLFVLDFIQNFNEFSKFDEKISKYINDINYQNIISNNNFLSTS